MDNYTDLDVKRYGPQRAADNCDTIAIVKNHVKADSYATFLTKVIASAPIDNTDWSFTEVSEDLRVDVAGVTGVDPSGTAADTDDLSLAVYDSVNSKVYIVSDAVDRNLTNETGDLVNIPALRYWFRELAPVA